MPVELIVEPFAGPLPGGWDEAAKALGIGPVVGIEIDRWACATRTAAGHVAVRADAAAYPVEAFAGKATGLVASAPCQLFSAAGTGIGRLVLDILAAAVPRVLAGDDCRAGVREQIYPYALKHRDAQNEARQPCRRWPRERVEATARSDAYEAALVLEPARYIHGIGPSLRWVALEQVREVLPLWRVYVHELRRAGWHAWAGNLNAADYGVPQTRIRAILIASRARRVGRPAPTHYNPKKGDQLWGERWVTMAQALGWGAEERPSPAVTAGGTATGGAEPFPTRAREILTAAQAAGEWALRVDNQANATVRSLAAPAPAPAPALKFGHSAADMRFVLRSSYGKPATGPKNAGTGSHGTHEMDPVARPAHTVTGKAGSWTVACHSGNGDEHDYERGDDRPAPSVTSRVDRWTLQPDGGQQADACGQATDPPAAPAPTADPGGQWVLQRQVGKERAAGRRDHPLDEPAPTVTGGGSGAGSGNGAGLAWKFRNNNNNNNNACERSLDEPAGTLFFGGRSNWAAWVVERPATTVQGDPQIGRPGHKDRDQGEAQFEQESVRIEPAEAAALQSFRPGYPWQGTRSAVFRQIGDAVPPLLGLHVLAEATGIPIP